MLDNIMASQSAIAEGGSTVTADSINYQQKLYSHPSYKFEPQFPNTFGSPIVLGASQIPITINIPPEVFNLGQSILQYSPYLPQGQANTYTWMALQALREISHIQFYSGNNQWIVDIDNLQNYLDILLKKEQESDDFLSNDPMVGVSQSNSPVSSLPALRNSNITNATNPNLAATNSSVNYLEPGYFTVASAISGANQQGNMTYNVQFPLKLIKNTAFAVDKSMYFGQTTYMKIYFGPLSKICYSSTVNDNPSNGTKTSYVPLNTATAGFRQAVINNLQLLLAVETNQDIRTMTINKVMSGGLSYMIPYVQAFKNSNSGGSQTVSIQLDQGNGRTLMKAYHAPYNSFEDQDTMYDHANSADVAGASATTNYKVQQYYTQLNGKRNQDITIDCTSAGPYWDYMSHRRQLRGSILSNLNVYQYNWFHCDDFSDFGPRYDQDNNGELISGIPMSVAPLTWTFNGTVMRALAGNNSFQHYTWFVFIKKLTMAPGQVIVD